MVFWFGVKPRYLGCECRLLERSVEIDSECGTVGNGGMITQYGAWYDTAYTRLENSIGHPQYRQWRELLCLMYLLSIRGPISNA
jgi:hypothetical protein